MERNHRSRRNSRAGEGNLFNEGLSACSRPDADNVKLKPAMVSWQNEQKLRFVLSRAATPDTRMCELVGLFVTG